jgi:hypothetical protein
MNDLHLFIEFAECPNSLLNTINFSIMKSYEFIKEGRDWHIDLPEFFEGAGDGLCRLYVRALQLNSFQLGVTKTIICLTYYLTTDCLTL